MVGWDLKADWSYKVKKASQSLHANRDYAEAVLKDLEHDHRCPNEQCNGSLRAYKMEGVWHDVNKQPYPREVYLQCVECGEKWVFDTEREEWHRAESIELIRPTKIICPNGHVIKL